MYSVHFTQTDRTELIDAQDWYEGEAPGLGRRFREAIDAVIERMRANPLQFPVVYKNVRRALLRRFPYSLFFVMDDDTLLVIAVFMPAEIHPTGKSEPDQRSKMPVSDTVSFALPCRASSGYRSVMPRRKDIDLADMTAGEELRNPLQRAERMQLENVAAALRRILRRCKARRVS